MSDPIERQDVIEVVKRQRKIAWENWHETRPSADRIIEDLKELPSAQPEIVHCKDCKWKQGAECVRFAEIRVFPNDFCSRAERREE